MTVKRTFNYYVITKWAIFGPSLPLVCTCSVLVDPSSQMFKTLPQPPSPLPPLLLVTSLVEHSSRVEFSLLGMCLPEHLKIPQKKNSEIFLYKMIVPSLNEQLEKKKCLRHSVNTIQSKDQSWNSKYSNRHTWNLKNTS